MCIYFAVVLRLVCPKHSASSLILVVVGPAVETLKRLNDADEPPFDLVFIDADKDGYPQYLQLSLPLTRDGGLILADNALTPAVLDPQTDNGITRYNQAVAAHPNLVSVIVPVLRSRGIGRIARFRQERKRLDATRNVSPEPLRTDLEARSCTGSFATRDTESAVEFALRIANDLGFSTA